MNMNPLDRICLRLRSVVVTDDAGVKHRMNNQCKNLLSPNQMNCDRCESEIEQDRQAAHSVEIQG